ncbi:MAG: hypothetical protein US53_C0007G0003 [Candidatus Woesebacteria bacterium GW2011_GWA1_37_7]|uniref:EamA domain-containing protein n=1 Tax=Candidatus Woesebacteria bacterium GW2011_GWA1_37_7 TaxID=1618545 RepID=A0A0G0JM67_9BACT|nr:MAG: hypothetical protein US53_C0007G0003 [Candidatus Woesebacteria bacterium GW2011_GWA1_37_7]
MSNVLLLITIAAISGGSVPPFAKLALEVFQPFTLVFIRFFFAVLVMLPFVYKKKELSYKSFKNLFWVAIIGSLNPILLFIALQFTKSSVAPLIYASIPLMTVVFLSKIRHHEIPSYKLFGVILGFLGVGIIILLPFFENGQTDLKSFWGNLLIFGAAIAFLAYTFISKDKQQKLGVTPIALTFYFALAALLLSIPFSFYEISQQSVNLSNIKFNHIIASLEIGIVGTSIFYLVYQQALRLSSELTAALFTYLQPVATVAFAILLLGERITLPFIFGGILAVVGAQKASRK